MTLSDVLYEAVCTIIDDSVGYYSNFDMVGDNDAVEVIACLLKVTNRRNYLKSDKVGLARVEAFDWKVEAKKFIRERLVEKHIEPSDSDEE